jgi:hypothetical protein
VHADAILRGKKVPTTLRVTEIFRFERGGWKLVHRHGGVPKDDEDAAALGAGPHDVERTVAQPIRLDPRERV